MITGGWSCLISFALAPLSCLEREGSEKYMSQAGFQLRPGTVRQGYQRFRPLGHDGLTVICGLMSYRIVGYKLIKP